MFSPVPISRVVIDDGFWAPRLERNREATLPMVYERCKESGRLDALRLKWKEGDSNKPHVFWESDVAKWMEAAAYSLRTHPDPKLERQLEDVIALIARAQQPDGYINSYYTVVEPGRRWTNLRGKPFVSSRTSLTRQSPDSVKICRSAAKVNCFGFARPMPTHRSPSPPSRR